MNLSGKNTSPPACTLCARWCQVKRCDEDLSLLGEWEAIGAALANYQALDASGRA